MPAGLALTLERLFEVATLLADALDRGLEHQGLSRARAEVLWRLQHQGATTQRELATALHCTPRNVTGLVDALEAQDLVERQPHPRDRRAVLVALTPQGEQTVAGWQTAYRSLASDLLGGIPEANLLGLNDSLEHIIERLREVAVGGGEP